MTSTSNSPGANQRPHSPLTPESDRAPRWWRYVHNKQLVCPAGHHFKNAVRIKDSGEIQCQHWIDGEKRECGLWVFVFPIRGGRAIVVEATQEDIHAMEEMASPAECFDYLGIFEPTALARIAAASQPPRR